MSGKGNRTWAQKKHGGYIKGAQIIARRLDLRRRICMEQHCNRMIDTHEVIVIS